MSYGWELHHIFNQICKGEKNANSIEAYYLKQDTVYPEDAYRMLFITNHDENSWNGTVRERMGDAANTMAVLSYTLPGMPLIYSGQEVGLDKRLEFFEKDEINWDFSSPLPDFYTTLNNLKKDNPALWNGLAGGDMIRINSTDDEHVFAFLRKKDANQLFVVTNLTGKEAVIFLRGNQHSGEYKCVFSDENEKIEEGREMVLKAWESKVYIKQ
ncbi:MAG: alpha-amylase family glycosyl hydrolase [Bacteroidales bacterium]